MPANVNVTSSGKPYLYIVGGAWKQKATKDTPGAQLREYELSNGTTGSKYELSHLNWGGTVQNIEFKDSDYGTSCHIHLEDAILTFSTNLRYFADMASKLMSADLSKPIVFHPWNREVDGKVKSGVKMSQGDIVLQSHYYDGENNMNGFPEVDQSKKGNKNYWKMYFLQVEEFLVEEIKKLKIEPPKDAVEQAVEEMAEQGLDDLPF